MITLSALIVCQLSVAIDTADVTDLLKELHHIVNEAIRAAEPGASQMDEKRFDISTIELEKLRDEFARKVKRKASALEDIRQVVEKKLEQMLARNPQRMDFYKKVFGDHRRLQSRQGSCDHRGNVRAVGGF